MILGGSSVVVKDTMTGEYVVESFKADANLDGVFDEKDSLSGYNLYSIISPISFSCSNLAASVFKNSNIVTMLGQTSGGGTCWVMPLSLADGTMIWISSYRRMGYIKNGSIYDIDLGVEPDIYIAKPSAFYDRVALTEYINSDIY
jgi:C-terminal processing protease CtpA/Prc